MNADVLVKVCGNDRRSRRLTRPAHLLALNLRFKLSSLSSAMACSKEAVLELKDVVLAVKEVTRWYEVGLQLGLPEEMLKLISAHPDIEGHQRMMLSKWLSYDTKASWTKLVAALRAIGERSVAEKVARQFVGVAVDASRPDRSAGQDPETRKGGHATHTIPWLVDQATLIMHTWPRDVSYAALFLEMVAE